MAEHLEAEDGIDCDREIDNRTFVREKFKLFKEAFRDIIDANDNIEHEDEKSAFDYVDSKLKRQIINLTVKLQKLEKNSNDGVHSEAKRLNIKLKQMINMLPSESEEIEQSDLKLVEYNVDDLSLFFGDDQASQGPIQFVEEALSKFKEKCITEMTLLIAESTAFIQMNAGQPK
uniref:THO complex subunit 7 n=1 Tax=Rhabditophanes sp. KR3021 TaxID=114890 RepID=A0AC35TTM8_9BILA